MKKRKQRHVKPPHYPPRVKLALIILVAFSLFSSLELVREIAAVDFGHLGKDPISLYDQRFKALRPLIESTEVVGYFTGLTPEQVKADSQALAAYYLTQYALAPVIVVNEEKRALLVGNFGSALAADSLRQRHNLEVLENLGNGLFLLKGEAP